MKRNPQRIYLSRRHLMATLLTVAAPFLFILFFSRWSHIASSELFSDLAISFGRLAAAYFLAAVLGWLFAVLFYRGRWAVVMLPVFDVLQSFPTFAALPLAVFFWGSSNITIIFFLIITIIWPIFFSIVSSLKLARRDWYEAVAITRLSGFRYLRSFLWPVSVPGLVTGSIVGLGEGWEALIATEIIVGVKNGLGDFFQAFSSNPRLTAFGIFGFLLLIFSINKLLWLPLLERSHKMMEE